MIPRRRTKSFDYIIDVDLQVAVIIFAPLSRPYKQEDKCFTRGKVTATPAPVTQLSQNKWKMPKIPSDRTPGYPCCIGWGTPPRGDHKDAVWALTRHYRLSLL
eukprot:1175561-Prorocentrum_minimum.AAC.4